MIAIESSIKPILKEIKLLLTRDVYNYAVLLLKGERDFLCDV